MTIEILTDIKSDGLVLADPSQIHQILLNICTNAGHAMQEKGGVLQVSLAIVELDSNFVLRYPGVKIGPYIQLTVADSGHGMRPSVLDRIFDPFFGTKEKGKGTGLGLSVVHGIVESHGGMIYVYSEPGQGSTFKVFLPAIERRSEPQKRKVAPLSKGTEKILLVDDEKAIIDTGKQMLSHLGYEVTSRLSSQEALELFTKDPNLFDLVITDQTMPGMTGQEVAEKLIEVRSNIPIILCTGFSLTVSEKKGIRNGYSGISYETPVNARSIQYNPKCIG